MSRASCCVLLTAVLLSACGNSEYGDPATMPSPTPMSSPGAYDAAQTEFDRSRALEKGCCPEAEEAR